MIKLHNTLTRKTEVFAPITPGVVSLYSCGPTVYWFAHIGNMRAFLFSDLLRRALESNGLDVTLIMNITDVGHLVGDLDDGEDKMIVAMLRDGKSAYDIAEFYAQAFFRDLEALNVKPAAAYPRATEHIEEQIAMVEALEKNGFTYRTRDGIYFDTSKLPTYGRLSGQKAEEKLAGARIEMGDKRNATDFALWKVSPEDMEREMEWESPWGTGFPGWHLECSAMAKKYLGVPFDLHTGGIDHIAVHHENEIAQTEGADGVLEANVWMHSEFLTVDGGKMSKSIGNVYTMKDVVARGYDPIAFRYFVLGSHYASKLNFTWDALTGAQNALHKLRETVRDWPEAAGAPDSTYAARFQGAINDNLNTPEALATLWALMGEANVPLETKAATLLKFDEVLGLGLAAYVAKRVEVPAEVVALVAEREAARAAKNWAESDRLRDAIMALGFSVEDTSQGSRVKSL